MDIQVSDADKKIIEKVMDCLKSAQQDRWRQFKTESWNKCYKAYMSQLETVIPRRSNLFIPKTHETVEVMVARELQAIYGNDSFFQFEPETFGDGRAAAAVTKYANFDIKRVPNNYRKMGRFLRIMHIYGTSILKLFWDLDYTKVKRGGIEELRFIRDHFNFDVVHPKNFYIDPVAYNLDDAKWVITRNVLDVETFNKYMDTLEYPKMKKEQVEGLSNPGSDLISESRLYETTNQIDMATWGSGLAFDNDRKFIEILEYWSVPEDRRITIAGGKVVLINDVNPFEHKKYPFVVGIDIPDPEHFLGISTVEGMYDLQQELNSNRNRRQDKYNFTVNPMFKVKYGSLINRKDLVSRQGGVVQLRDVKDLESIDLGSVTQQEYLEENNIKADIQSFSSITDGQMGMPSKSMNDQTATSASILNDNAGARITSKVAYLESEVFQPMAYLWLSLQAQFGKDKERIMISGDNVEITRDMMLKHYDFRATAVSQMTNRQIMQNGVMQLMQFAMADPEVNHRELLKWAFDAFRAPSSRLISRGSNMPMGMAMNMQAPGGADPNAMLRNGGVPSNQTPYDFAAGRPL